MSPVLRKGAQLNIKYRRKRGPHNRCLHRRPTWRSYDPAAYSFSSKNMCFENTLNKNFTTKNTCKLLGFPNFSLFNLLQLFCSFK